MAKVQDRSVAVQDAASIVKTGWPPGLLQDDDKGLSKWLANRIDSKLHAREAVVKIQLDKEKKV